MFDEMVQEIQEYNQNAAALPGGHDHCRQIILIFGFKSTGP